MKTPAQPRASTARQSLEFFKGFLKNPREVGSVIPARAFSRAARSSVAISRTRA